MSVTIRAHGMARDIIGGGRMEVDLAGDSLGTLINQLASLRGEQVRQELLDEHGNLHHAYLFFVAGQRANSPAHRIKDGDEVMISSMLAGGS